MVLPPPFWSLSNRIRFVVAYDGTDFCGWAANTGRRTVQGTLTETIRQVSGEDCEIVGASRTDSGAHAHAQVCHFDSTRNIPNENWMRAVNTYLPGDVRVLKAEKVLDTFHSRFCAVDRWYRYKILVKTFDPFRARFSHDFSWNLDPDLMSNAAQGLVGRHDFRALTEELDSSDVNTWRSLTKAQVTQVRDEVRIDIVGTAFLRGMMRRMAGALLEIGRGARAPEDIARLLGPGGMQMHRPVVLPAKGLTLMKIHYGRHPVDNRTRDSKEDGEDVS